MTITTEMTLIFTEFAKELQIFADGVPMLLVFCVAVMTLGVILTGAMMFIATLLRIGK